MFLLHHRVPGSFQWVCKERMSSPFFNRFMNLNILTPTRLVVLSPFKWRTLFSFGHLQYNQGRNSSTWWNGAPIRSAVLSCLFHLWAGWVGGWVDAAIVDGLLFLPHGVRISGADSWRLRLTEPAARIWWLSARRKKLQLGRVPPPRQQPRDASFHNMEINTCPLTWEL